MYIDLLRKQAKIQSSGYVGLAYVGLAYVGLAYVGLAYAMSTLSLESTGENKARIIAQTQSTLHASRRNETQIL